MRKVLGLILLLAGTGVALYAFPIGEREPSSPPIVGVAVVSNAPAAAAGPTTEVARPLAARQPLFTPQRQTAQDAPNAGSARLAPNATGFADDQVRRVATSKPVDEDARRELIRDLQRELRRVGCYDGEIVGIWNSGSRRAMSAFVDRVNAALPVEEPDYILLTLVQGHAAQVCGRPCPAGQAMADDGRCLPRAVLARGRKLDTKSPHETPGDRRLTQAPPKAQAGSSWTAVVEADVGTAGTPQAAPPALPGRMAVGAPADPAEPPLLRPLTGSGGAVARLGEPSATLDLGSPPPPARDRPVPPAVNRYDPPQRAAPRREASRAWNKALWDRIQNR